MRARSWPTPSTEHTGGWYAAGAMVTARRATARRALGRAALVVASTLATFGIAEGVLRATGHGPQRWIHPAYLESADKRHALDLYPDDPRHYFPLDLRSEPARSRLRAVGLGALDTHWQRTPFGVPFEYSEELCRGHEVLPKDPARLRVVVIGDSFTEGQGVREEDTFAVQLHTEAEVVNCGRRGYDFPALGAWFDRQLALEPDVVVYAMVLNDVQQSAAFHAQQRYLDDWILDRRRMVTEGDGAPPASQSWLWALAADRIEGVRVAHATTRWYQAMVGAPNLAGWNATLAHVQRMHEAMQARGGAFLVVLWPLLVDLDGDYPFAATHRTIARALAARGIAFFDALPDFRGRDPRTLWVHATDRHPNERAHAIFARAIEPRVREVLAHRGGS